MKVCDKHSDRRAIDTLHMGADQVLFDVCEECKQGVYSLLSLNQPADEVQPVQKPGWTKRLLGKS